MSNSQHTLSNFEKVIEFSIGGAALKLQQTTQEAKDIIKELKDLRVETFKILLKANLMDVPTWSFTKIVEDRSPDFISIYEKIKDNGCVSELLDNIENSVDILLRMQLRSFKKYISKDGSETIDKLGENPKPMSISFLINENYFQDHVDDRVKDMRTVDEVRYQFELAMENYTKLYLIQNEVKNLKDQC